MSDDPSFVQLWGKGQFLETRDLILTDVSFQQPSYQLCGLAVAIILSCKPEPAERLVEQLFQVPEFSSPETVALERQRESLSLPFELFWSAFSCRPDSAPWEQDKGSLEEIKKRSDPCNVEFYESWAAPGFAEQIAKWLNLSLGSDYDVHQWKDSQDPQVHGISARFLCQPKDGMPPSRENVEEAFDAIDRLYTGLPSPPPNHEPGLIFPWRVYFILALHLGRTKKAREILQLAQKRTDYGLHQLLDVPELYKFLAESRDDPPLELIGDYELKAVEEMLLPALKMRVKQGRKAPLHDVSMLELMRRFSEAAFFVHRAEYVKNGIKSPPEILCPPLTEEEIVEIEGKLGPLPPDVKEMALVSDGFHGGWHLFGGGWGGIKSLWRDNPRDYEIYLGYEPEPIQETRTSQRLDGSMFEQVVNVTYLGGKDDPRRDWECVYVGSPMDESDDYQHVLCPPETWKKMQAAMGKTVKEGEYAYLHYAHWTDGGEISSSVRENVASMTMAMERNVAVAHDDNFGNTEE